MTPTGATIEGPGPPQCPHPSRALAVRAAGLITAAFSISVTVDQAMVGAATTTQQAQVTIGAIAIAIGVALAAGAQLHTGRGTPATTRTTRRISQALMAAALGIVVVRGLPQLAGLIEHVRADRDEPTTTLVYLARLAVTGTLTAALACTARRSR